MHPTLDQLIHWAHEAGEILREGFGLQHDVQKKGRTDLVTEMDHRSEAFLIAHIQREFPQHAIFSEESGQINGRQTSTWYVDPLDGTVNYAHGVPFFCVSIAYADAGEVRLGVVYDPLRDETFAAEKGKGACLNGTPLAVARADRLVEALLVTGFAHNLDQPEGAQALELFTRFARVGQVVRLPGAAALELCYVACGRYDGYWEKDLHPYDMAAGALIASEAGALVTRPDGSLNLLEPPCDLVVANPSLHAQMLQMIHNG
jgi:myo-inositol-1(or 4)-monophosphatase